MAEKIDFQFISNKPGPEGTYPINLYLVPETEVQKAALRATPGLVEKVQPLPGVQVRNMIAIGNNVLAVCGRKVYMISTTSWESTEIGELNNLEGYVWIERNRTQVMIVEPPNAWIYDTVEGTFVPIQSDEFFQPDGLAYHEGFFLYPLKDGDVFYHSALNNGDSTGWDSTDYVVTSARPDNIRALASIGGDICILGDTTMEWAYLSTNPDQLFPKIQGSHQDVGCSSPASVRVLDNSVFFLDNSGRICRTVGNRYQVVSSPEIITKLSEYDLSSVVSFAFHWDGHPWYVVNFIEDDKTWVYDTMTNFFFQWSSGVNEGRFRGSCHTKAGGFNLIGDFSNGKIYALDADTYTDNGSNFLTKRTAPELYSQGNRIFFSEFEMFMKTGVGQTGNYGIDNDEGPLCYLRWSDNGMRTWSNKHKNDMGKIGKYNKRVRWFGLGSSERRVFEWESSAPVEREIYGVNLRADIGRH